MAMWPWTGKQRTIYCLLEQTCVETSWFPKFTMALTGLSWNFLTALSLDDPAASMMVFIQTLFECAAEVAAARLL